MRAGRGMLANVELSRPVGYGMHCVDRFGTKFLNARLSSYSVSYTHLDVYKRQTLQGAAAQLGVILLLVIGFTLSSRSIKRFEAKPLSLIHI